jgi:hypothetical protein
VIDDVEMTNIIHIMLEKVKINIGFKF